MTEVVLIAHNLRSAHNVGSLLRTAEGLGVTTVYLTGYTPYPHNDSDTRIPHLAAKIDKQIHKTALGAEGMQPWQHEDDVIHIIEKLKKKDFTVCALEQTDESTSLADYSHPPKIAVIVGNEVEGLDSNVLNTCDKHLMIPMKGKKESFNVVQAAAMCLYQITNTH